jgi:23S rRNA pseudouridine1911/1915/1917 synthase
VDVREVVVAAEDDGLRIDQLVAARIPALSRARVQQLLAEGRITVAGQKTRPSRRMQAGEQVRVEVPPPVSAEDAPEAQDLPLEILYEDEALVVIDKPAGMAAHPAPGSPDGTVVNVLLHRIRDLGGVGGELRPGIVHRLDKDTTGLMVVAKSDRDLEHLQGQFKARTVEKAYWALVHGAPKEDAGLLDAPLARHPKDRKRFSGRHAAGRPDARPAETEFEVLERYPGAALVEARPRTGRTHQIRVHLSEAGHPLLGDALYGGDRRDRTSVSLAVRRAAKALGHHALHARRLAFDHPRSEARLRFEASVPPEWDEALALLGSERISRG